MCKTIHSPAGITFNRKLFKQLKKEYQLAIARQQTKFIFKKRELDIRFAMYLIEYLEKCFNEIYHRYK